MTVTAEMTLTKFAGWYRNYASRPTINVEVLPDERHCAQCGIVVFWIGSTWPTLNGHRSEGLDYEHLNFWLHVGGEQDHTADARQSCHFCNGDEVGSIVYRQEAWCDSISCSRCGGDNGYPIGD